VIDRFRKDIQARLEQLLAEIDKLQHALGALDPRRPGRGAGSNGASATEVGAPNTARTKATAGKPTVARTRSRPGRAQATSGRTASGATKAKVLSALSPDSGMTAGEVATAAGLSRGTVSTTLSKLAKSGEIVKANRGYRLPG
jgi:CRP-like cAMP-binding protein